MIENKFTSCSSEQTGLQKLTVNQLINIILRKDNIERQLRYEIRNLKEINRQLSENISEKKTSNITTKILQIWQKLQ